MLLCVLAYMQNLSYINLKFSVFCACLMLGNNSKYVTPFSSHTFAHANALVHVHAYCSCINEAAGMHNACRVCIRTVAYISSNGTRKRMQVKLQ